MADTPVSTDEFLDARKDYVRSGDVLMKASRSRAASSWDPEKRTIQFVMSAEVEDRDRDIVMQAGLLTEEFMKNPQAFYNHNARGFPVGHWSDIAKVNGRPKRTEGTLNVLPEGTDEVADRLAAHLGVGSIKACSIGFIPKRIKRREKPEGVKEEDYYWPGYLIEEAELVECSPCTIPSNPAALAKMAADGDVIAKELIELVLDTWAKHPETGLIIPRSEFESAHKQATSFKSMLVSRMVDGVLDKITDKVIDEALAEAAGGQNPEGGNNEPPQPETPPVAPASDPEANPPADPPADPAPQQPLTEEQKDSLLTRLFKWFGSTSDEDIERELAAKKRREAEEAIAAAERREKFDQRFQNLETRLGEKGLVD